MDPEIALLIAVAEQMPMHQHIVELVQAVKERAAERERLWRLKADEVANRGTMSAEEPQAPATIHNEAVEIVGVSAHKDAGEPGEGETSS